MAQGGLEIATLPVQGCIGGGYHPDIHFADCPANRLHFPLLQGAQQLGLHLARGIPDLIHEQGAALCLAKKAGIGRGGTGKRAAHIAKQGGRRQARGYRRHIDAHQRAAARAGAMQGGSHQFLAGAGLAPHQHIKSTAAEPGDLFSQRVHIDATAAQTRVGRGGRRLRRRRPSQQQHHAVTQQNGYSPTQLLRGERGVLVQFPAANPAPAGTGRSMQ